MTHYTNTNNPIDFPTLSAIDILWGQALDRVVPETYSSLSLNQIEKVKTVFTELVVRECIIISQVGSITESKLKQHFGVEE